VIDATERVYRALDGDENPIAGYAACAAGALVGTMLDPIGFIGEAIRRGCEDDD
jgi:hypothetical protein